MKASYCQALLYYALQKEIASERAEEIQKLEQTIEEKEKAEIAAGIAKPQNNFNMQLAVIVGTKTAIRLILT